MTLGAAQGSSQPLSMAPAAAPWLSRLPSHPRKPDTYTLTPSDSEIGTSEGEKGKYLEALWQQSLSMKPDYHHVRRKAAEKKPTGIKGENSFLWSFVCSSNLSRLVSQSSDNCLNLLLDSEEARTAAILMGENGDI